MLESLPRAARGVRNTPIILKRYLVITHIRLMLQRELPGNGFD